MAKIASILLCVVLIYKYTSASAQNYANISAADNTPQSRTSRNPLLPIPRGCLNSTGISKTVYGSHIIFSGKIISLIPLETEEDTTEAGGTADTSASEYYYYNFARKRRKTRGFPSLVFNPNPNVPGKSKTIPKSLKWIAWITIKTIFKGGLADKALEGKNISLSIESSTLASSKCLRRLRALDTRIFFYRRISGEKNSKRLLTNEESRDWSQTLMPLPPTLLVLNAVREAVKGKMFLLFFCIGKWECYCINLINIRSKKSYFKCNFNEICNKPQRVVFFMKYFEIYFELLLNCAAKSLPFVLLSSKAFKIYDRQTFNP